MDLANPSYSTLDFNVHDGVARITLDRPNAANALDMELCKELLDAAIVCSERRDVRAVILTGNGTIFCAGGDLKYFAAQGEQLGATIKELTNHVHGAISHFARMDAPVVCAVNGMAAGAGASLAFACDFTIASDAARFTLAYTAAGLSPDGSSTWYLPRLVGLRRARELMLTNRRFTAVEALDMDLIDRVVAADVLMEEAERQAAEFAAGPTRSYGITKRLLLESSTRGLESQTAHEALAISELTRTADAQEGIDAFVNKRKPAFRGT